MCVSLYEKTDKKEETNLLNIEVAVGSLSLFDESRSGATLNPLELNNRIT